MHKSLVSHKYLFFHPKYETQVIFKTCLVRVNKNIRHKVLVGYMYLFFHTKSEVQVVSKVIPIAINENMRCGNLADDKYLFSQPKYYPKCVPQTWPITVSYFLIQNMIQNIYLRLIRSKIAVFSLKTSAKTCNSKLASCNYLFSYPRSDGNIYLRFV